MTGKRMSRENLLPHPICCKWRRFRAESTRSVTVVRERPTYSTRLDIVGRFTTSKQFPRVTRRWRHDQGRITIARDATLKNCVRFSVFRMANWKLWISCNETYVHCIRVTIEGTKIRGDDETEVGAGSQDFYFFAYVNKLVIDVRWRLFFKQKNFKQTQRPDC